MKNTPSGSGAKISKYMFFEELRFLDRVNDENVVEESLQELDNVASVTQEYGEQINAIEETALVTQHVNDNTTVTQRPWSQKRKNTQRQSPQQTSQFEKELLVLLSKQTPDLSSDDLAFFSSLGPILNSFDLYQKLEFRTRVLKVAKDIQNMCQTPSSILTSIENVTYPDEYRPHTSTLQTPNDYQTETAGYQTQMAGYQTQTGYQTTNNSVCDDNEHQ
ncbi:unnamed protein product [Parnassius apollo]|uniref:(apollo) hypothetical protein n=1 Tax=Parnassius apollo TaxID=110799 RepID=A0A8S3YAH1_PARAO|nr:unnamed protein product [Parnassius apollo]